GEHVAGGALTGASVIAPLLVDGWPGASAAAALAIGGYALGLSTPPAPPTIDSASGTLGQFTSDVTTQYDIDKNIATSVHEPQMWRINPSWVADTINNNPDEINTAFNGGGAGSATWAETDFAYAFRKYGTSDLYGTSGYKGPGNPYCDTVGAIKCQ